MALSSQSSDEIVSPPPRTPDEHRTQTLQTLQETIQRLETRLEDRGTPRERQRSGSVSSRDGGRAKLFKNIPEFTLSFKLQQRQEWILDLEYSFKGARRSLRKNDQKIIAALPYMSSICRQRWYRHLAEKTPESRQEAEGSWQYFTEWTLTLIQNAATLQPDTMSQLQRARQRSDQDPREFHGYLDALEQHFPRQSEEERALTFFAKLLPELGRYIQEHHLKLPETRDEMVSLATHHWNLLRTRHKRKHDEMTRDTASKKADRSSRDRRPESHTSTKGSSLKSRKNPTNGRGNTLRCFICDSETHLANRCPQKGKKAVVQSAKAENIQESE
jgi:hypothetical protein